MIRKVLLGIGALTLLGLGVFGLDLWSYAATGASSVQAAIHDQIPLEFELKRAQQMIADLVPDIHANMKVIAAEEVEVEHLQKEAAALDQKLSVAKADIVRLRTDLEQGRATYVYTGQTYTAEQVRADLTRRFDRYRATQSTLESKHRLLAARTESLSAARDKLINMHHAKADLEAQVENLAAQLKTLEATQTASQFQFDDSKLSRAKKLVNTLQKRLETAQKLIQAQDGTTGGLIPLADETPREIEAEVDEYFSAQDRSSSNVLAFSQ